MKRIIYFVVMILFVSLAGCQEEPVDGKNSLVDLLVEPEGGNCSNGGIRVVSGLDLNDNNTLDPGEIQDTEYICNGEQGENGNNGSNGNSGSNGNNGLNSLIDMIAEPPGNNCSEGGFKIITGLDVNSNNILDNEEIQGTEYLCNMDSAYSNNDHLLRVIVMHYGLSSASTEWFISGYASNNLSDFCKEDYANVDSIIFVPSMHSNDAGNKCIVELFNITDGVSIENSLVESNDTGYDFHYSKNIYEYLPSNRVDIGVRIRSEHDGIGVMTGVIAYLYIYKH